jgi:hypothetical protein
MQILLGPSGQRSSIMLDLLVSGFLLTGSVCISEGDRGLACRDIPSIRFGNKYSCDDRVDYILSTFPSVRPEQIGFPAGENLKIEVKCKPAPGAA